MKISQVYFFFSKNQNQGAITGSHSWFLPLSSPFALMVQWLRPEGCSLSSVPLLFHGELPPERHTHPWILQGKFDIRSEPGSLVYHQSKRGTYSAFPMKLLNAISLNMYQSSVFLLLFLKTKKETKKTPWNKYPKFMYGVRKIENKMTSVLQSINKENGKEFFLSKKKTLILTWNVRSGRDFWSQMIWTQMFHSSYPFPTEITKWILYKILYECWKRRKGIIPITETQRVDEIH